MKADDAEAESIQIFWGEIAPCDHLVQIYEDDDVYLDSLEGFISGGLRAGDGVIVIATQVHGEAIDRRLKDRGIDIVAARERDQYISLDAHQTLAKFMIDDWPDAVIFENVVSELLSRARKHGRVRAFGEMVALMWERGHHAAVVRLEHLWHRLCEKEGFSLFCAYPKSGFTNDARVSVKAICDAHSRVIPGIRSGRRLVNFAHSAG
jgi:hypothetical protein